MNFVSSLGWLLVNRFLPWRPVNRHAVFDRKSSLGMRIRKAGTDDKDPAI